MKPLLFSLFIIGSMNAFSQSAKKINERLRAQFVLEQQKQDSSYIPFFNSLQKLQQEIDLVEQKRELLVQESRNHRHLKSDIRSFESVLKSLEPGYTDIELNKEDVPSFQSVTIPIRNALISAQSFDKVSNRLYLEMMDRKEQNAALTKKIEEYKLAAMENKLRFLKNEQNRHLLEPVPFKLDSLLSIYKVYSARLEETKKAVEAIYLQNKENYRLKGPEGFPDAYHWAFPDVHAVTIDVVERELDSDVETEYVSLVTREVPIVAEELDLRIYDVVDEVAAFPGGTDALKKFLDDKLVFPAGAKEKGLYGKTYLKFVVSKSGMISDVVLMKGVPDCPECDEEAKRLVKSMPNWIPAKKDGKNVHSYAYLPVTFRL